MSINYPKEKFEQAAYCFLVLYQKDEMDMDMGQVIERTISDTILYCQNDTLKKIRATILLLCYEITGYVLDMRHIQQLRKCLEIVEDNSFFNERDWQDFQTDLVTAKSYIEWSMSKHSIGGA